MKSIYISYMNIIYIKKLVFECIFNHFLLYQIYIYSNINLIFISYKWLIGWVSLTGAIYNSWKSFFNFFFFCLLQIFVFYEVYVLLPISHQWKTPRHSTNSSSWCTKNSYLMQTKQYYLNFAVLILSRYNASCTST